MQLKSVAAQSAPLNDQLRNRKGELEEKIGAVDEQIKKLKEQGGKLEAILEKISQLLPHFANAAKDDQGIEASQHILASIVRDQVKATRLADAIERKSSDEISSLVPCFQERTRAGRRDAGERWRDGELSRRQPGALPVDRQALPRSGVFPGQDRLA